MLQRNGFTLLEVLLATAILAMIAVFSVGSYRNFGKSVELDSTGKNIIYDLRQMQVRASSGEGRLNWGIHFVNGPSDYYEIFSSPTGYADIGRTISSVVYLPAAVRFSVPAESASADVVFASISGGSSANSITINSEENNKIISITAPGAIY